MTRHTFALRQLEPSRGPSPGTKGPLTKSMKLTADLGPLVPQRGDPLGDPAGLSAAVRAAVLLAGVAAGAEPHLL